MAVAAADAVAAGYLAEAGLGLDGGPARAAGGGLAPGAWPTYLHPRLANTRALERFRNQVPWLGSWLGFCLHGALARVLSARVSLWEAHGPRLRARARLPRARQIACAAGPCSRNTRACGVAGTSQARTATRAWQPTSLSAPSARGAA